MARRGPAWLGAAGIGEAGKAWRGGARPGAAMQELGNVAHFSVAGISRLESGACNIAPAARAPVSRSKEDIAASIPVGLLAADDLLTRYGRWAITRGGRRRCGSAESAYRAPPNDEDRQPRELVMDMLDALAVQRALARVPDMQRVVLAVLYVPQRMPPAVQLRLLRIPPRLSRDRHLSGLRMFWSLYRMAICVQSAAPGTASVIRQPNG